MVPGPCLDSTFLDLGYLVRNETVRLAVYGLGRFLVGSLYEAEDLARTLVEPVPVGFHPYSSWISSSLLWASAKASAVNPSTDLWWSMNIGIVPLLLFRTLPAGAPRVYSSQCCEDGATSEPGVGRSRK